jgi:hypothetical protein
MRYPTVDWRNVSLLGIDVGFSKTRATTGIAVYEHGSLRSLCCVKSSSSKGSKFDAIAIDGPILPATVADGLKRLSASLLIGRGFNVRCKPGMSHHGFGLDLRRAAEPIVAEACLPAKPASKAFGDKQIRHSIPLVEAFPNAFLVVGRRRLPSDRTSFAWSKVRSCL